MPDPRDFLPQPPWEGPPLPLVLREVLGLTGGERITVTKETFLTFVRSVRDLGYGPTVADAHRLLDLSGSYLGEQELEDLDLLYTLWIAAENPEEAERHGLLGGGG